MSCGNAGQRAEQFGFSLGTSLLGLIGLGGLVEGQSPLSQIQSQVQSQTTDTNNYVSSSIVKAINKEINLTNDLFTDIQKGREVLEEEMKLHNEVLNLDIKQNTVYIMSLWVLMLIIFGYIIIS